MSNINLNDHPYLIYNSFLKQLRREDPDQAKNFLETGISYPGNEFSLNRIASVMRKALSGQKIVIAAIGGSITEGAGASSKSDSYSYLVYKWWKKSFPQAEIKYINAGIGATGSILAVHRLQKSLLDFEPDFVICDFSVNDASNDLTLDAYESLVRRIFASEKQPGILHLAFSSSSKANVQEMHESVCINYGIPLISFRDAIWQEIDKPDGRLSFKDPEAGRLILHIDEVHPNDQGHMLAADLVNYRLAGIFGQLDLYGDPVRSLPKPVQEPGFMKTYLLNSAGVLPAHKQEKKGFAIKNDLFYISSLSSGWISSDCGDEISIELEGRRIFLWYLITNADDAADFNVFINEKEAQEFSSYHKGDWKHPKSVLLVDETAEKRADEYPLSKYRIRIQIKKGQVLKILGFLVS